MVEGINKLVVSLCGALAKLCEGVTMASFFGLFSLTLVQVFFRYVLNEPLTWTEAIARWCFVVTLFFGTAYVALKGEHIVIDVFLRRFPPRVQGIVTVVSEVMMAWFGIHILAIEGWKLSQRSMFQTVPAIGIPMGWVHLIMPVAGIYLATFLILRIINRWLSSRSNERLPGERVFKFDSGNEK